MSEHLFQTEAHAKLYAEFRPSPPPELFEIIVSKCASTDALLDVGCGSGQSTEPMTKYFSQVTGSDNSEAQIIQARKRQQEKGIPNLSYRVCSSNELQFEDQSFNVITASQCVHWFDLDKFYPEAHRVLRKDGLLALFGYCIPIPSVGDPETDAAINERIVKFYRHELRPYWEVDMDLFDGCYQTLPVPKTGFELIEKNLDIWLKWSSNMRLYINYLRTWSPYEHFRRDNPDNDIMESLRSDLRRICLKQFQEKDDADCEFSIDTRFFLYIYKKLD